MSDTWERIDGKQAVEIELLNYNNQVNFIKSLFLFWQRHAEKEKSDDLHYPTQSALKDLHKLGTLLLLENPGAYRTEEVIIRDTSSGQIAYTPPHSSQVPSLINEMFTHLDKIWETQEGHEIAAYLLWRINWIHPFNNGNGRTARGFAYACLCLKANCLLPGKETVIDLIIQDREPLYSALKDADKNYIDDKRIDVSQLSNYLFQLYIKQLKSAGIPINEDDLTIPLQ